MIGLMRTLLGRMRYRRRWSGVAEAAKTTADKATAEANRRDRDRRGRNEESFSRRPKARTVRS